jgi:outer membrane receptor protein involved in Fe transport
MKQLRLFFVTLFLLFTGNLLLAQDYSIQGKITDRETGEELFGAIVVITPGNYGNSANMNGEFVVRGIPAGDYTVKASMVGYTPISRTVTINHDMVIDFRLASASVLAKEVIVEVNRARERETPVAFSDIDAKTIDTRLHGQDAPLLIVGTPGVYSFSPDGVGNGESKMLVRGFSQNYVQVLVNGIPTNDAEGNAVYWSNWAAVSSAAASIQVQRGAGSSLYGAGAFGGSFNIVTQDAMPTPYYGVSASFGSPLNTSYGINLNTGLIDNKFAFSFRLGRKVAEGSKTSGRYEGINYYLSGSYFPADNQTLKLVVHGAPQKHGYSYSTHISYYKKYGYDANGGSPVIPRDIANQLPTDQYTGLANWGITDNSRELVDNEYVNIGHNFFHKPQFELHYSYDINKKTALQATAFYTIGRGGGSSLSGAATMYRYDALTDAITVNNFGGSGLIENVGIAENYLRNAVQRVSYSFHQQAGIHANISTQPADFLKLTGGVEFRYWNANHPGHYTNLFGKEATTFTYRYRVTPDSISSFVRSLKQGDLVGPESDYLGNVFGWKLAGDNDPAYKSQYRNYDGTTPQFTVFLQGNWLFGNLNLMTSLQFVNYTYKLYENMPSENAIGQQLTESQVISKGITGEGAIGDKFYMLSTAGQYYEFDLIREDRSNSFFQPKIGANYNLSDEINVFGNYAYVQRFVDLGVYYNQGRLNPDAEDEKSNQFELGLGYTSGFFAGKVNGYYALWQNKSTRLQDHSKSGQPGYDYQGFRTELIGTSQHMGIEFAGKVSLNELVRGLELNLSLTAMDNTWKEILDEVKYGYDNKGNKIRRAYNASALNANGVVDTLFFDKLENTKVASGPQTMMMAGFLYNLKDFYFTLNMNYFASDYMFDGGTYMAVDGELYKNDDGQDCFKSTYDNQLPSRALFDFSAGYRFNFSGIRGNASFQILNIFNTEYLASSDAYGVIPGMLRAFRFNVSIGF